MSDLKSRDLRARLTVCALLSLVALLPAWVPCAYAADYSTDCLGADEQDECPASALEGSLYRTRELGPGNAIGYPWGPAKIGQVLDEFSDLLDEETMLEDPYRLNVASISVVPSETYFARIADLLLYAVCWPNGAHVPVYGCTDCYWFWDQEIQAYNSLPRFPGTCPQPPPCEPPEPPEDPDPCEDSDFDGVPDSSDLCPCDPECGTHARRVTVCRDGQGTILGELWQMDDGLTYLPLGVDESLCVAGGGCLSVDFTGDLLPLVLEEPCTPVLPSLLTGHGSAAEDLSDSGYGCQGIEDLGLGEGDPCDPAMVGNPVRLSNGNKFEREVDLRLPSPSGKGLVMGRYYNSLSPRPGPLGYGWSHTYSAVLQRLPLFGADHLRILDESGRGIYFTRGEGGGWEGAFKEPTRVTEEGESFVWHRLDGSRYGFSGAGRLEWMDDSLGNRQGLFYDSGGRLASVTDEASGRVLFFHYGEGGLLSAVSGPPTEAVPDGVWARYSFDGAGNLIAVTYPGGSGFSYAYSDPVRSHGLTEKRDGAGHLLSSWRYDGLGRAAESCTRDGRGVRIEYLSDAAVETTDAYGRVRTYRIGTFEGLWRVTEITGPGGCTSCVGGPVRFRYDEDLHVVEKEYADGSVRRYGDHDLRGNPGRVVFAAGTPEEQTIFFTYHPETDRPLTRTEASVLGPGNKETVWDYDAGGDAVPNEEPTRLVHRLIERGFTLEASGAAVPYEYVTLFEYDARGLVTGMDGPLPGPQDKVTYTYDPATGDLLTETRPLVGTASYAYDLAGNMTGSVDANGIETVLAYDGRNRPVTWTRSGMTERVAYNLAGTMERTTDAAGRSLDYTYSTAGFLETVIDPAGNTVSLAYDALGNPVEKSLFSGGIRRFHLGYDYGDPAADPDLWPGRPWRILRLSAGGTMEPEAVLAYDPMGRVSSVTDGNGNETAYRYDPAGRLAAEVQPDGIEIVYRYDLHGNLTGVTGGAGQVTAYARDDMGRLVRADSPDTGVTRYIYDAAGNLILKDRNGTATSYDRDALGRLAAVHYEDGSQDAHFFYDQGANGVGRLTGTADPSGSCRYGYDPHGRLVLEEKTLSGVTCTTAYTYDPAGIMTGTRYPGGLRVEYGLDSSGRIEEAVLVDVGGGTLTLASGIEHLPFGPVSRAVYSGGAVLERTFDLSYRVSRIEDGGVLDLSLERDGAGNVTEVSDALDPSLSLAFGYDALSRLIEAHGPFGALNYLYDDAGNRLSRTGDGGISEFYEYEPGSNRLARVTGSVNRTFAHDAGGNLIRITGDVPVPVEVEYLSNAFAQRVSKTAGGATTVYHYDPDGRLIAETTAQGELIRAYAWLEGAPLALIEGDGRVFSFHNDHLATPRRLTDSTGAPVWAADYLPFGQADVRISTVENNLRFPGQYFDKETGLHYNWHRYYDPGTGRYLTPDPIGLNGGMNLYSYSYQNPINYIDPLGLDITVTLYPGASGFGHVGAGVNTRKTTGFYPDPSASGWDVLTGEDVPGVMRPDSKNPIESIAIHTTPAQDQAMQNVIDERTTTPGNYNLYNRNCTITVQDILKAGGITLQR